MPSIRTLIQSGEAYLVERGVPNARRNAEWILGHALGCHNTALYVDGRHQPRARDVDRFRAMLARRGRREPLQYVLETTEFMALPFAMGPGVFIPRPDTEVLVEVAEALLARHGSAPYVCDLCCGSGAIAVSLARRIEASVVAVDASEAAVALTRRNAQLNNVDARLRVVHMDAVRFIGSHASGAGGVPVGDRSGRFDAIVSNPPYVPSIAIDGLPPEIRDHEPRLSLDGGADGIDFYRRVVPRLAPSLKQGGIIVFEIGDDQAAAVTDLLRDNGYTDVTVHPDYNRCDRVVSASLA